MGLRDGHRGHVNEGELIIRVKAILWPKKIGTKIVPMSSLLRERARVNVAHYNVSVMNRPIIRRPTQHEHLEWFIARVLNPMPGVRRNHDADALVQLPVSIAIVESP